MAGKRIGDHQVGIYKKHRNKFGQEVAAAKAGISVRSARRIDDVGVLPSQREGRGWRTRSDPLEAIWQSELLPMLEAAPALTTSNRIKGTQTNIEETLQKIENIAPEKRDDWLVVGNI